MINIASWESAKGTIITRKNIPRVVKRKHQAPTNHWLTIVSSSYTGLIVSFNNSPEKQVSNMSIMPCTNHLGTCEHNILPIWIFPEVRRMTWIYTTFGGWLPIKIANQICVDGATSQTYCNAQENMEKADLRWLLLDSYGISSSQAMNPLLSIAQVLATATTQPPGEHPPLLLVKLPEKSGISDLWGSLGTLTESLVWRIKISSNKINKNITVATRMRTQKRKRKGNKQKIDNLPQTTNQNPKVSQDFSKRSLYFLFQKKKEKTSSCRLEEWRYRLQPLRSLQTARNGHELMGKLLGKNIMGPMAGQPTYPSKIKARETTPLIRPGYFSGGVH